MDKDHGKYLVPSNEEGGDILPNKQGITSKAEIDRTEFIGFLKTQNYFIDMLNEETIFNLDYLYDIHSMAFRELYDFAGNLRTVNMSKGGFVFPAARFLLRAMRTFESDFLLRLSHSFESNNALIKVIAQSHAELIYIHPFREGNGRTARLLSNLISIKHLSEPIDFGSILLDRKDQYIKAVQQASNQQYDLMEKLIKLGLSKID
jgi:cell filamentation protein, protein adenylyltransferase